MVTPQYSQSGGGALSNKRAFGSLVWPILSLEMILWSLGEERSYHAAVDFLICLRNRSISLSHRACQVLHSAVSQYFTASLLEMGLWFSFVSRRPSLANESTISLPRMPRWLGTQQKVMLLMFGDCSMACLWGSLLLPSSNAFSTLALSVSMMLCYLLLCYCCFIGCKAYSYGFCREYGTLVREYESLVV